MLYIEIIKVMDLDVLPNAQCTQFHGKWAEKDRNFGVTLMIEPVFMRATREGVKITVVLLSLAAFIRYAYTVHDAVTGSMILEETLERARNNVNEKKTIDSFEQEGSQMGNPRLYLGAYELHLNLGALSAEGDAAAGDWSLHIERADIHPETFLRQQDALKKIKDRIDD